MKLFKFLSSRILNPAYYPEKDKNLSNGATPAEKINSAFGARVGTYRLIIAGNSKAGNKKSANG